MAKAKLTWFVPRWAFAPQLWRSLVRITLATIIASAVLVAGLKWALPQMNLWLCVFAVAAVLLILVSLLGVHIVIPPIATVRGDKILVQHGEAATIVDTNTVTATYLTFHSDKRVRLRICYRRKSKRKPLVIGVPPTMDFERLTEILPISPVVRDTRDRSFTQKRNGGSSGLAQT